MLLFSLIGKREHERNCGKLRENGCRCKVTQGRNNETTEFAIRPHRIHMFEGSCSIQTRCVEKFLNTFEGKVVHWNDISDVAGLRNSLQIEVLQDQTHLMLQEYCGNKAPLPSGKLKFGKILLTMPLISQVNIFSPKIALISRYLNLLPAYKQNIIFSIFRYLQEVLKPCSSEKRWATLLLKE